MSKARYIIGIDEVGRGALAGPVAVCATLISASYNLRQLKKMPRLRDSKKMSEAHRKKWAKFARGKPGVAHEIIFKDHKTVDQLNISRAANLAAQEALNNLIKKYRISTGTVFLDAGLRVGVPSGFSVKSIVHGDDKIPAISLASVLAKTERDTFMRALHFAYPRYGFMTNVGYGTKKHIRAIKRHGFSTVHRLSFCV